MVLRQDHNREGRCDSCGLLSKRSFAEPGIPECHEASLYDRDFGGLYIIQNGILEFIPWCFVGAANLRSEVEDLWSDTEATNVCVVTVITKDRKCPQWYLWTEFLSPKEHFEELKMLRLEQRREEFEQRLEKERKEFDLKLFEISQRVQKDSAKVAEKAEGFNRRMTWFFIVLAILGLIGALLPLVYPDGIPWLMNLLHSHPYSS